jgi:uncharacterized protein (TIGR03435 family)
MKALKLLFLVLIAGPFAAAQTPPLTFEVASVRPNNSRPSSPGDIVLGCRGTDSNSPGQVIPHGRCVVRNQPLRLVIALAYDIPPASMYPYQGEVLSGPDWMNNTAYDIEATSEGQATQAQLKIMLQNLLAERFKLKMHREKKEMPVYALTMKNAHKLQPASKDRECGDQLRRDHRYELGATSLTGHCHAFIPGGNEYTIQGQSVDMSDFAEMLSIWAGRIVVDRTGLPGLFDIKLPRFGPGQLAAPAIPPNAPEGVRERLLEVQSLPTLFNVLDQLGFKLESTKAPVEVIVVDNLERPSEN